MPRTDTLSFLKAWRSDPRGAGAIAPSGLPLAALITREVDPANGPVVELGPGTGVFTRALLSRGVEQKDLTLIELNREFAAMMQERFPGARVLQADAARMDWRAAFGEKASAPGAVVSGLPLLNLPRETISGILANAFSVLRSGGAFYQFTYFPRCPVPRALLTRHGLEAARVGRVLLNVPPATVYRVTRKG